ncbi:MAG: gamma-glutamyl-gamma-aminobutyrate hydrolase family protein [Candidatus Aminicenantes bacterium]|nr:gamma-glutamyl-gamma-aminobutyrate hydrolase family protein [Candidatus Aminicenantes bacterium]
MTKKLLIINTSSDEILSEYVELLSNKLAHLKVTSDIVHYKYLDSIKLFEYKGIILSPTTIDDDKPDTKESEVNWASKLKYTQKLITYNSPILGICGGHLLLGLLFGSKIIINSEREVNKNSKIKIIKKVDPLFSNLLSNQIEVSQFHNNSITVPPGFNILASSEICKNQIMKHKKKFIYGSQFHIEENDILFGNFINIVNSL